MVSQQVLELLIKARDESKDVLKNVQSNIKQLSSSTESAMQQATQSVKSHENELKNLGEIYNKVQSQIQQNLQKIPPVIDNLNTQINNKIKNGGFSNEFSNEAEKAKNQINTKFEQIKSKARSISDNPIRINIKTNGLNNAKNEQEKIIKNNQTIMNQILNIPVRTQQLNDAQNKLNQVQERMKIVNGQIISPRFEGIHITEGDLKVRNLENNINSLSNTAGTLGPRTAQSFSLFDNACSQAEVKVNSTSNAVTKLKTVANHIPVNIDDNKIESAGQKLGQLQTKIEQVKTSASGIGSKIGGGLSTVDSKIGSLTHKISSMGTAASMASMYLGAMGAQNFGSMTVGLSLTRQKMDTLFKSTLGNTQATQNLSDAMDKMTNSSVVSLDMMYSAANKSALAYGMNTAQIDKAKTAIMKVGEASILMGDDTAHAQFMMGEAFAGLNGDFQALKEQFGITRDQLKNLGWDGTAEDVDGYTQALEKAMNQMGDTGAVMDTTAGKMEYINKTLRVQGRKVGDEIVNKCLDPIVSKLRDLANESPEAYGWLIKGYGVLSAYGMVAPQLESVYDSLHDVYDACGKVKKGLEAIKPSNVKKKFDELKTSVSKVKDKFSNLSGKLSSVKDKLSGLGGKLSSLKDSFSNLGGKISKAGKSLKDFFSQVAKSDAVTKLKGGVDKLASAFVSLGKKIAKGLVALKKWVVQTALAKIKTVALSVATKLAAVAQALFNLVMSMAPIFLLIAGIVALIAVFALFTGHADELKNALKQLWDALKSGDWGKIKEALSKVFEIVVQILQDVWDAVAQWFGNILGQIWDWLSQIVGGVVSWFTSLPGQIWAWLTSVYESVSSWFGNLISGVWEWLSQIGSNILSWLTSLPGQIWTWLSGIWNSITSWFGNLVNGVSEWLGGIWNAITTWFTNLVMGIATWLLQILTSIVNWFLSIPETLLTYLTLILTTIQTWLTTLWTTILLWGQQLLMNIATWLMNLPQTIWTYLQLVIQYIQQWASTIWNQAITAGMNFVNGVIQWIRTLPSRFWSWLMQTLQRINPFRSQGNQGMQTTGQRLVNAFIGFIQTLPSRFWSWLRNTINRINPFSSQGRANIASAGRQMVSGFGDQVKQLPQVMWQELMNIGSQIRNGAGQLVQAIRDLGHQMLTNFKNALGIHSPGYMFKAITGEMEYIDEKLEDNQDILGKQSNKLGESILKGFTKTDLNSMTDTVQDATNMVQDTLTNLDSQDTEVTPTTTVTPSMNMMPQPLKTPQTNENEESEQQGLMQSNFIPAEQLQANAELVTAQVTQLQATISANSTLINTSLLSTQTTFNNLVTNSTIGTNQIQANNLKTIQGYQNMVLQVTNQLNTLKTRNTQAWTNVKTTTESNLKSILSSTKSTTQQMVEAWNYMKTQIIQAASEIRSQSQSHFNQLSETIGSFYRKLRNPGGWGTPHNAGRHKPVRPVRSGNNNSGGFKNISHALTYGANVVTSQNIDNATNNNRITRSTAKSTLEIPVADLNYMFPTGKSTIDKFELLQANDKKLQRKIGAGWLDVVSPNFQYIKTTSDEWRMNGPQVGRYSTVDDLFQVKEFENGVPSISFDTFRRMAEAVFSQCHYEFYWDSAKYGNWVTAFNNGGMNCSDSTDALVWMARACGLSASKVHGYWGSLGHFWANVAGHKMDTTGWMNHRTWTPAQSHSGPAPHSVIRNMKQEKEATTDNIKHSGKITLDVNVNVTGNNVDTEEVTMAVKEALNSRELIKALATNDTFQEYDNRTKRRMNNELARHG